MAPERLTSAERWGLAGEPRPNSINNNAQTRMQAKMKDSLSEIGRRAEVCFGVSPGSLKLGGSSLGVGDLPLRGDVLGRTRCAEERRAVDSVGGGSSAGASSKETISAGPRFE